MKATEGRRLLPCSTNITPRRTSAAQHARQQTAEIGYRPRYFYGDITLMPCLLPGYYTHAHILPYRRQQMPLIEVSQQEIFSPTPVYQEDAAAFHVSCAALLSAFLSRRRYIASQTAHSVYRAAADASPRRFTTASFFFHSTAALIFGPPWRHADAR